MRLIDTFNGAVFGEGEDKEACIADAIRNAFYGDNLNTPCTREWVEQKLRSGDLAFEQQSDIKI